MRSSIVNSTCSPIFQSLWLLLFYASVSFSSHENLEPNSIESAIVVSQDLGGNCELLLEQYAEMTANFTRCFVQHARPIMVCQKCVEMFLEVEESHENILKLHEDSGEACQKELLNVDRLGVIEQSFTFVLNQWKKAACPNCFTVSINSTQLNSETEEILKLHNDTYTCIKSLQPESNASICDICRNNYTLLNNYYIQYGSHRGFCMDIVDMMNSTRYEWSSKYNCSVIREKPELIFFISSISLCALPLIFYFSIWIFSVKKFPEIIPRRRNEPSRLINN